MDTVFEWPRTVLGAGCVVRLGQELAALGVRRPLLVSDGGLVKAGLVAQVQTLLPAGAATFAAVTPNPVFDDVSRAQQHYSKCSCDGVVALGGGSVIDTAKFVALLATHGGRVADHVAEPAAFVRPAAPLVAIPTTAGTGSEASPDAGIHPDAHSASVGASSRWAVPRVAVLDPMLTLGLPPGLTAATGIDALTHCIEGFLSRNDSPLGDLIALDGVRRVVAHLPSAVRDGGDLNARTQLLLAGYQGGVAIGMGLGPAHAVAIACGDQGLHHGVLSGIGCVATLDAVLGRVPDKATALRQALGVPEHRSAAAALAERMRGLGLPATLREAGYRLRDLDALAETAHRSPFNGASRWHPSVGTYRDWMAASNDGCVV